MMEAVIKHNSILVFDDKGMPLNKTNNYHPESMICKDLSILESIMRTTRGRIRTLKRKQHKYKKDIYANKKMFELLWAHDKEMDLNSMKFGDSLSINEYEQKIKEIGLDIEKYNQSIRIIKEYINTPNPNDFFKKHRN